MLNLALDTATPWGRFALTRDAELLGYRPLNIQGSYADALMPVITDLLAEAGCSLDQVGGIGITMGPGSFTGVRIGVATAKALAYALDCELVAVTTLEAMAGALLADHGSADLAVPVLDARRGEVFAGVYAREGSWVRPLSPPAARSPERWWMEVMTLVEDPEAPIYGGEGAHLLLGQGDGLRTELKAVGEPRLRPWSSSHPRTAVALALAMAAPGALPRVHPFALTPEYMRVSDAEIKRRVDLTPLAPPNGIPDFDGGGTSS